MHQARALHRMPPEPGTWFMQNAFCTWYMLYRGCTLGFMCLYLDKFIMTCSYHYFTDRLFPLHWKASEAFSCLFSSASFRMLSYWNNTACDPVHGLLLVRWTSVLVIFQLLWQNTTTKVTDKRKYAIWDSRLQRLEFMFMMMRHNTAGKQTWHWARAKNLHLDPQVQKRKS